MEVTKVSQITDNLKKYTYGGKDSDYITLTEWANGEGYDIDINGKLISLSNDELEAINYLTLASKTKIMDDIIVLDYSNGKVYIYTLPRLQMYDSEIEDWLDSMSFDLSNINWMVNKNITINDERK